MLVYINFGTEPVSAVQLRENIKPLLINFSYFLNYFINFVFR